MILVTGASGALGSAIARHLPGPHLLGSRTPDHGGRLVDFDRPQTLDFTGVDTLVLISAGYGEDDVVLARHGAAIDAAERDGVGHVVYTSLAGAGDHTEIALPHRWTERRLAESTLRWTVLRNGLYAELLAMLTAPVDGRIVAPLGTGGLAAVARNDLARVAAAVASAPHEHEGAIHELVGERSVTGADVAERLGVPYTPMSLADYRALLDTWPGLAAYQRTRTLSIVSNIAAGMLGGTGTTTRLLLGAAPTDALEVAVAALT